MFSQEIHPHVVRASAVTTNSYVAGSIIGDISEYNSVGLEIKVTKGSLDSVEVKIEESQDGENYYQQVAEASSSGTISTSLAARTFTVNGSYAILINPVRAKFIKVSTKGTGTVTSSLVAIKAYTSWA